MAAESDVPTRDEGDTMVVEVEAGAVAANGVGAAGGLRHRLARRKAGDRAEPLETPRDNPAWRLLGSEQELHEAIERAIACEQASIAVSQQRVQHLADLRTHLAPGTPMTLAPAQTEDHKRARPGRMPRAS